MIQTSSEIVINVSNDVVWQLISDFGTPSLYFVNTIDCRITGQHIGAERTLTSADGSAVVERLETLDNTAQRLSYSLLTNTPFRNCLTTMAVHRLGANQTELEWSATFDADGIPATEARALQEGALAANCLALKQFLEANKS